MIVSCPACATRFSLDAALLGDAGRNVRCAKCSHKWKQLPPKLENPDGTPADIAAGIGQAAEAPDASPQDEAAPAGETQAGEAQAGEAQASEPSVEIPAAPPRPRTPFPCKIASSSNATGPPRPVARLWPCHPPTRDPMTEQNEQRTIDALLAEHRTFPPSAAFKAAANLTDPGIYERAAADPA